MSRSYKKNPCWTDGGAGGPKSAKREANKKVRNTDYDDLPLKGKYYKKYFEQYDIHDSKSRETLQEALEFWEQNPEFYENRKECYRAWYKAMKAK